MSDDMHRVFIKGVAMPSRKDAPVVILGDEDGLGDCTVAVGPAEAGAILMSLEGVSTPRPLTHELMASMLAEQGVSLNRVELYRLNGAEEEGFLARIEYGKGFRSWVRDVRPSDALALAVTTAAPIFAHHALLERPDARWREAARQA